MTRRNLLLSTLATATTIPTLPAASLDAALQHGIAVGGGSPQWLTGLWLGRPAFSNKHVLLTGNLSNNAIPSDQFDKVGIPQNLATVHVLQRDHREVHFADGQKVANVYYDLVQSTFPGQTITWRRQPAKGESTRDRILFAFLGDTPVGAIAPRATLDESRFTAWQQGAA